METIIGGHYSHQHDPKWPDGHRFSDSWQPRYDEWVGQWGAGKAIALLAYENLPNSRLRAGHVLVDVTETAARRGQDMASFLFWIGHPAHGSCQAKKSSKPTRTI